MYNRNSGIHSDDIARNKFTAYVVRAIENRRSTYVRAQIKRFQRELPIENVDLDYEVTMESDFYANLPLLEQLDNHHLADALMHIKSRDLQIFIKKAIYDRTLREIASELGMGFHATTSAYYRVVRRLRAELGGDSL